MIRASLRASVASHVNLCHIRGAMGFMEGEPALAPLNRDGRAVCHTTPSGSRRGRRRRRGVLAPLTVSWLTPAGAMRSECSLDQREALPKWRCILTNQNTRNCNTESPELHCIEPVWSAVLLRVTLVTGVTQAQEGKPGATNEPVSRNWNVKAANRLIIVR